MTTLPQLLFQTHRQLTGTHHSTVAKPPTKCRVPVLFTKTARSMQRHRNLQDGSGKWSSSSLESALTSLRRCADTCSFSWAARNSAAAIYHLHSWEISWTHLIKGQAVIQPGRCKGMYENISIFVWQEKQMFAILQRRKTATLEGWIKEYHQKCLTLSLRDDQLLKVILVVDECNNMKLADNQTGTQPV